jgi:hypothetical protein
MNAMRIPAVGELITQCWVTAEESLRELVRNKYADRDEEIITTLFHSELESEFRRVSDSGTVARAFLSDLKQAFPRISGQILSDVSSGLVATVSFHPKHIERATGGDFGLVLVRPDVRGVRFEESALAIEHDYKRGLLVQAKIWQRSSRWRNLNRRQREVLREKSSYLALVLYRYSDQHSERRMLKPFAWQLAQDATVEDLVGWLASNVFPDLRDSAQILTGLAEDKIGTDDEGIIQRDIAPPLRPSLEIKIHWRDGRGPGRKVQVQQDSSVHIQQHVVLRRS